MTDRVLVPADLPAERIAELEQMAEVVTFGPTPPSARALATAVAGCRALVCRLTEPVDAAVLATDGLELVSQVAVGLDNIDLDAARARGVRVTHTPGVLTDATADLAMAMLLSAARRLGEAERFLREGQWTTWRLDLMTGLELRGARLGIVGFGRIGRAVAHRALAFGMEVVWSGPRPVPAADGMDVRRVELDELLASSDVISLHAPLTPETRGLLSADRLAGLKPGAILVNTARGAMVDEAALAHALDDGPLAFAALDVFQDEPHVHPSLLERDDVLLLPHIGSATRAARGTMARMATRAVLDHLAGREPANLAV